MERVWVVQQVPGEDLGTFGAVLEAKGVVPKFLYAWENPPWPDPAEGDGVVVLGGWMSVHDAGRLPWLQAEMAWLGEVLAQGLPYFGICLGLQLMIHGLGGTVYRGPCPEIGVIAVRRTDAGRRHPLFSDLADPFPVFSWHGETVTVPPGCTVLAASGRYPVQAVACGPHRVGLQFHLEAHRAWLRALVATPEYRRDLSDGEEHALGQALAAIEGDLSHIGRSVFGRWLAL
ncbi:MAG: type 1 glutamine amidotransferase [Firmicutes bacterium]|nr:type 1 glutamine amidotransferase [Alicyclobacillaceae bacterium]MCL6496724.1 type 1 glutamine amidotransferase [Bacillota bacterium]